jgi:glycosyltransferase involved in cell wall biosynthesis
VNVALLNPVYWPEVRRGAERMLRDLATGLLAEGDRVRLITSHPGRPTTTVEDGLRVERLWRPPGRGRLARRHYEDHLTHVPGSYLALRRAGDDAAIAFHASDALAAARWSEETGRPFVFAFMGIPHRQGLANRRWRKELVVRACERAAAVTALSEEAADGFARWLGVEAHVIAPGVDLVAFTPAPDPVAARAGVPTILCAADPAEPRKRVALLADAFARVRAHRPDAQLVLAARPGASAPQGPGIVVRDLDGHAALLAANREAWVHVLPSFGEAFGLVLAEALACGTPVVGPTAALTEGVGERFTGQDPGELAAALERALGRARDPATASACRARAERFSATATAAAYRKLLGGLTAA